MAVGDVGRLTRDRTWTRLARATDLGITIDVEASTTPVNHDFSSAKGAQVRAGLSGNGLDVIPGVLPGSFGIHVEFQSAAAFMIQARQCVDYMIVNQLSLEQEIWRRYSTSANWNKDWLMITEVTVSARHLLAVSLGKSGEAGISLGVTATQPDIGAADATARVAYQSQKVGTWLTLASGPLMFRTVGVVGGRFGAASVGDPLYHLSEPEDAQRQIGELLSL